MSGSTLYQIPPHRLRKQAEQAREQAQIAVLAGRPLSARRWRDIAEACERALQLNAESGAQSAVPVAQTQEGVAPQELGVERFHVSPPVGELPC